MAHPVQQEWCESVKTQHPHYFSKKRVLDVGSLDINGNNRCLFSTCDYIGLDVVPGKNVDVIGIAHEYISKIMKYYTKLPDNFDTDTLFDVVLSTNALEHDMYWQKTLKNMFAVLKPSGLMFFSVANSWPEHGTKRTTPSDSGTTQMGQVWENYYYNLQPVDIEKTLDLEQFYRYNLSIFQNDLRFWGIKKG